MSYGGLYKEEKDIAFILSHSDGMSNSGVSSAALADEASVILALSPSFHFKTIEMRSLSNNIIDSCSSLFFYRFFNKLRGQITYPITQPAKLC